ncbi:rCG59541 [Rattus norvegicus]|uniref:RCG59541 n=1 Tax=Rattus norvegicus TaxID=10116 RepID=A6HT21_RAT|nr:rCG59541 [Rattus norvegicus]
MLKKLWVGLCPGNQELHLQAPPREHTSQGPWKASFSSVPRLEDCRSCQSGKQTTAPSQQRVWTKS